MTDINLLPKRITGADRLYPRFAARLKFLNIIGISVAFIGALVMIAVLFVNTQNLAKLNRQAEALKASIASMSDTEQQYFLIKDRLEKLNSITEGKNFSGNIASFSNLIENFTEDTDLTGAGLSQENSRIDFNTQTAGSLARTFSSFMKSGYYSQVLLDSFSYTQAKGYKVSVSLKME